MGGQRTTTTVYLVYLPTNIKLAKIIAPNLIPNTLSNRYPPIMGSITFGQEYKAYKFSNWAEACNTH